jgi:hypothetical protein
MNQLRHPDPNCEVGLNAKHFGIKMDPKIPMVAQQRAYISPIWYTPK